MLVAACFDVQVVIVAIEELDLSCTSVAIAVRVAEVSATLAFTTAATKEGAPPEITTKHTAIAIAASTVFVAIVIPLAFTIIDSTSYYSVTIVASVTRRRRSGSCSISLTTAATATTAVAAID